MPGTIAVMATLPTAYGDVILICAIFSSFKFNFADNYHSFFIRLSGTRNIINSLICYFLKAKFYGFPHIVITKNYIDIHSFNYKELPTFIFIQI